MGFALGYDCRAQPRSEVIGKFVQVGVAVDLDGHFGCIADHVTIVETEPPAVDAGREAGCCWRMRIVASRIFCAISSLPASGTAMMSVGVMMVTRSEEHT